MRPSWRCAIATPSESSRSAPDRPTTASPTPSAWSRHYRWTPRHGGWPSSSRPPPGTGRRGETQNRAGRPSGCRGSSPSGDRPALPAAPPSRSNSPSSSSRGGRHVGLVDADSHAPSVALALGLADEAPGFAAACRQSELGGLDSRELTRISAPIGTTGVDVLTGLNRPSRWPELSESRVAAALAACREWADHTVVDVAASLERDEEIVSDLDGPRRNAATLAALRTADLVVAVAAADPLGISRFLRAYPELRATIGATPVAVVANRLRPGALGIDARGQVRRTLDRFGGVERCLVRARPTHGQRMPRCWPRGRSPTSRRARRSPSPCVASSARPSRRRPSRDAASAGRQDAGRWRRSRRKGGRHPCDRFDPGSIRSVLEPLAGQDLDRAASPPTDPERAKRVEGRS